MTRKKEPEINEMTAALEEFETALLGYLERLEKELQAEKESDNYAPLVSGLERQVATLRAMHHFVDEELWEQMLLIANMSQSLSHRRTGRFF